MGRLNEKNVLIVIPKDYYNEKELDPVLEALKKEGPANVRIASPKLKEAVGMRSGRVMPDLMLVDAIEGITGDSYVTGGRGARQIKGVFHGVIVIGGSGAKRYLWNEPLLKLLLTDRHRSGFVVAGIGMGVPCLGRAGVLESQDATAENNKDCVKELEDAKAVIVNDEVAVGDRVITARGASAVGPFMEAFIEAVQKTPKK
ncbi:MAG: DJ-1/PfpI family protein [Nitrospinae bacterium]|nr:DJ-1/PfpI family protein [Nitrospinota bacterium]